MTAAGKSSDVKLVRLAQSGEPGAFDQLIERHAGLVYHIARARLGDHESAEDLLQEVFLRVHIHLHRLREPERLAPWLAQLTRNLATDWLRRGNRRSQLVAMVPLDEEVRQVPDSRTPGAREILEADEQRQALQRALDRLPPEQRELVLLHYGEELEQREIAKRMGIHPSSVSRQLKRALKSLRGLAEPMLRETAPALRMPRSVVTRTSALIAASAAMSSTAKAAMAVHTAATPMATGAAAKVGSVGLLHTIMAKLATAGSAAEAGALGSVQGAAAKIVAGGSVMLAHKGAVAVAAVALIGGAGYHYVSTSSGPPDISQGTVEETFTPAEESTTDGAAGQIQTFQLSPGYEVGLEYQAHLAVDIIQDQQVHVPERGPEPPVRIEMGFAFDADGRVVEELPDGSARMEETVTDFQMGRLDILVEGETPETEEIQQARQMVTDLIGRMFADLQMEKTIDPLGNVTSLNMGGSQQEYQEYFDQSAFIRDICAIVMSGYPDRPLGIGDTWTREFEIPGVSGIYARATSTLDSVEERNGRQVAIVTRVVRLDIGHSFPVVLPPEQGIPPDAHVEVMGIRGRITAEEHILVDGMLPIRSVGTTDLRIPVRVSNLPEGQGPREVTIDTRQRQRFTAEVEYPS
jgi:RNA polymerase sigma-70 factor (ECF subfamily)